MLDNGVRFRVFVSSTFEDIAAERGALQEHVFPTLQRLCQERGAHFQAVDLRWGVSREASRDQLTMSICLDELRHCRETSPRVNFIAILGDRYGWCPLPSYIPTAEWDALRLWWSAAEGQRLRRWYRRDDNAVPPQYHLRPVPDGMSDTDWDALEAELRGVLQRAALQAFPGEDHRRAKYQCSAVHQELLAGPLSSEDAATRSFCYLREPAASEKGPPDSRLMSLRETVSSRLRAEGTRRYGMRQGPEAIVRADLETFCRRVEEDLRSVIEETLAEAERLTELDREIQEHDRFGEARTRHFRGRSAIRRRVHAYLAGEAPHPLVVHGPGGSGKSALMAKLAAEARERLGTAVVIWRAVGATPASSHPRSLLEGICREIERVCGQPEGAIPRDYGELVRAFHQRLALACPERRLVLFIDALDQLVASEGPDPLRWLRSELPPQVRLVVSVLDQPGPAGACIESVRRRLAAHCLVALGALPQRDGERLLGDWLREAGRTLQDPQRAEVRRRIHGCSLPLYLKLIFEECRRWKSYDGVPALGADVRGVLTDFFSRLEAGSQHGRPLVRQSLRYLAAARYGLSEAEMVGALSRSKEVMTDFTARSPRSPRVGSLPFIVWSRLQLDLAPYLAERAVEGAPVLGFYHRVIGDTVGELLASGEERLRAHRDLAAYFSGDSGDERQPHLFQNAGGEESPNFRKLAELPFQETAARSWDALQATLCDLHFVRAKCMAGLISDLVTDYERAVKSMRAASLGPTDLEALESVSAFVKRESHALRRYAAVPGFVLQQAHNRSSTGPIFEAWQQARSLPGEKRTRWMRRLHSEDGNPLLAMLDEHAGAVTECAYSADGRVLLSASLDGSVRRWDTGHWGPLGSVTSEETGVLGCALHPTSPLAASACKDGHIRLHHLETGETIVCEGAYAKEPRRCRFFPDGTRLLSCGQCGMMIHDARDGRLLHRAGDDTVYVDCAFAPGGHIALAGYDGVHIFDPERYAIVHQLGLQLVDGIFACAFSPDGRYLLAAGGRDHYFMDVHRMGMNSVWDTNGWREVEEHRHRFPEPMPSCAFLPSGECYVVGSADGTYHVYRTTTGEEVRAVGGHSGPIRATVPAPDGDTLVTAGYDGRIKAWSVAALLDPRVPDVAAGRGCFCGIADDGLRASVWSAETHGFHCTFHRRDFNLGLHRYRQTGHEVLMADREISLDLEMARTHLDTISPKTVVFVVNRDLWGSAPHRTSPFAAPSTAVAAHTTGSAYLLIGWSARLMAFDFYLMSGLPAELYSPRNLAWARSPDASFYGLLERGKLALCARDGDGWRRRVVEFETTDEIQAPPQCSFSRDGRRVHFVWGERLFVVEVATGKILSVLENLGARLLCHCESQDGARLAAGGDGGVLIAWNRHSGEIRRYLGHDGQVVDCAWLPTGELVSIGADSTLRLWSIDSERARAVFVAGNALAAFCASGRRNRILATDIQGSVYLLEVEDGGRLPEVLELDTPAARLLYERLLPRLRVAVSQDEGLQAVIEVEIIGSNPPPEIWYVTVDAGDVRVQRDEVVPLDLILRATLEAWPEILDGDDLWAAKPLGRGPLWFSGDLGKFGRLAAVWKRTPDASVEPSP
jgi:WD40 repeat protein